MKRSFGIRKYWAEHWPVIQCREERGGVRVVCYDHSFRIPIDKQDIRFLSLCTVHRNTMEISLVCILQQVSIRKNPGRRKPIHQVIYDVMSEGHDYILFVFFFHDPVFIFHDPVFIT
jgi:hypothetical protein